MKMPPPALKSREDRLASIERRLDDCERVLMRLREDGADGATLDRLRDRLAEARIQWQELGRRAPPDELDGISDHLARWIGNDEAPPFPRRLPPRPIGDPRRRD